MNCGRKKDYAVPPPIAGPDIYTGDYQFYLPFNDSPLDYLYPSRFLSGSVSYADGQWGKCLSDSQFSILYTQSATGSNEFYPNWERWVNMDNIFVDLWLKSVASNRNDIYYDFQLVNSRGDELIRIFTDPNNDSYGKVVDNGDPSNNYGLLCGGGHLLWDPGNWVYAALHTSSERQNSLSWVCSDSGALFNDQCYSSGPFNEAGTVGSPNLTGITLNVTVQGCLVENVRLIYGEILDGRTNTGTCDTFANNYREVIPRYPDSWEFE